jgi:Xaa-Pro dipeptidase
MPVGNGGLFTTEARAIYELVHTMQATAFGMLKPGVHWDQVHLATHRVLVSGLLKLGILRSGDGATEEEILNSGVTAAFYPHGLGHSLGMDVHDVPSVSKPDPKENKTLLDGKSPAGSNEALYTYLRLRLPLEAGMVVVRLLFSLMNAGSG